MNYRHAYHAGNFADVHKHVTLLALLEAMKRKEKGFLYLETHAGRGAYELSGSVAQRRTSDRQSTQAAWRGRDGTVARGGESASGIGRLALRPAEPAWRPVAEELRQYAERVALLREERNDPRLYPGSPLLAARELRPQDRAVLVELLPAEAHALEKALPQFRAGGQRVRIETGDGFGRLRAWLPPRERRGLTFIDPPYEDSRDFEQVRRAAAEALRRFHTGVVAIWYPIKDERDTAAWRAALAAGLDCEALTAQLWLYPCDSRVALNGSGMVILNPPYLLAERMEIWLPELYAALDAGHGGGVSVHRHIAATPDT